MFSTRSFPHLHCGTRLQTHSVDGLQSRSMPQSYVRAFNAHFINKEMGHVTQSAPPEHNLWGWQDPSSLCSSSFFRPSSSEVSSQSDRAERHIDDGMMSIFPFWSCCQSEDVFCFSPGSSSAQK